MRGRKPPPAVWHGLKLREPLGHGAFGDVFLAWDPKLCEVTDGGVIERGVLPGLSQLPKRLGPETPPARVAFEACREGWYVADRLTAWGHEPVMVDTTRVRQLGIGHHGRKNGRIDAEVLATALLSGRIPQAHILSPARQKLRLVLAVRRSLVETRASYATRSRSSGG